MSNAQTVGKAIFKMSPVIGFIAILSSSIVLFIFSSKSIQIFLDRLHLPTLPLVPVSSSQAIIGAIIGLGIIKGVNNIQYKSLSKIALGWLVNPILAGLICFISLFFMQNVFDQTVYKPTAYVYTDTVMARLDSLGIDIAKIKTINNNTFENSKELRSVLERHSGLSLAEKSLIAEYGVYHPMYVSPKSLTIIRLRNHFSDNVYAPLLEIENEIYNYKWQIKDRLSAESELWRYKPKKLRNDFYNSELDKRYELLFDMFTDF
jgi:PiT family inorganic phosphate transporter